MRVGDAATFPASFQLKKTARLHVPVSAPTVYRPYNVVAILEGSDPTLKDEAVTVFAHLDGAVGSREVDGDAIYNSADDNASGSAALLNIAEQMAAAPRPKRTIVFVWDSGEEQGLWGTRWFVHRPPVPLAQRRGAHQRRHDRRQPAARLGRRRVEPGDRAQRGVRDRAAGAEPAGRASCSIASTSRT